MPRFNFTEITLQSNADITDVMDNFNILENNGVSQDDLNAKVEYLKEYVQTVLLQDAMSKNPVGHIISTTNPANPATYMGFGTWVAWGSGRVPVSVNTQDSAFNTVEKTGGSKTITLAVGQLPAHDHTYNKPNGTTGASSGNTGSTTLTINQIPNHDHGIPINSYVNEDSQTSTQTGGHVSKTTSDTVSYYTRKVGGGQGHVHSLNNHTHSIGTTSANTGSKGSGQAITILQPYITCYMWKRTA